MALFGKLRQTQPAKIEKRRSAVLGLRMTHREVGDGRPIVFVHSGLGVGAAWSKILPVVAGHGRCIAIDPIGFGESERPNLAAAIDFDLARQQRYFDYFMEIYVDDGPVTVVTSGMASVLAFDWCRRHEDRLDSICHMESVFRPIMWPDLTEEARETLKLARGQDGDQLVVRSNAYFERIIREQLAEPPDDSSRAELLRLFGPVGDARAATLKTLQDFPINGYPAHSHERIQTSSDWLADSPVPKLMILGEPGYLVTGRLRASARRLTNQRIVAVRGKHVLPMDSPSGVATFLSAWLSELARR